jgi:predicted DNA-binding transcriptional regulator AlpA
MNKLFFDQKTLTTELKTCKSNIYKLIKYQNFPKPVKIGRASRWLSTEVSAWIQSKADQRSTKTEV